MTVIPIVIGALGKGTGGLGNKKMSRSHPNDGIIRISQNTMKPPGDLRRFGVIQTPVEDHQLTLVVINSQGSINNNNNNNNNRVLRVLAVSGGHGNKKTSEDYPNNSLVEIGQNTKKSPGDLRKLAETWCHPESNGNSSADTSVRNSQKSKIKINNFFVHSYMVSSIPI